MNTSTSFVAPKNHLGTFPCSNSITYLLNPHTARSFTGMRKWIMGQKKKNNEQQPEVSEITHHTQAVPVSEAEKRRSPRRIPKRRCCH